jgi:hypothetical protein
VNSCTVLTLGYREIEQEYSKYVKWLNPPLILNDSVLSHCMRSKPILSHFGGNVFSSGVANARASIIFWSYVNQSIIYYYFYYQKRQWGILSLSERVVTLSCLIRLNFPKSKTYVVCQIAWQEACLSIE